MMAFKGEVSAGDEVDFGIGQVTLESIGSSRDDAKFEVNLPKRNDGGFDFTRNYMKLQNLVWLPPAPQKK